MVMAQSESAPSLISACDYVQIDMLSCTVEISGYGDFPWNPLWNVGRCSNPIRITMLKYCPSLLMKIKSLDFFFRGLFSGFMHEFVTNFIDVPLNNIHLVIFGILFYLHLLENFQVFS